jgi:hypothetical protein
MIVFYGLGWLAGRDIFGIGGKGACPKNPYVGIWSGVLFDRESFLVMLLHVYPRISSLLSSVCCCKGIYHSFVQYDDFLLVFLDLHTHLHLKQF